MVVVYGIIINVIFGIVITVVVVVVVVVANGKCSTLSPTLYPTVGIIISSVDETKGSIVGVRGLDTAVGGIVINLIFGIMIAVIVISAVINCKGPTLSGLTPSPAVRIIIVCVDES